MRSMMARLTRMAALLVALSLDHPQADTGSSADKSLHMTLHAQGGSRR